MAKIEQCPLLVRIGHGPSAISRGHDMTAAKKSKSRNVRSEYDLLYHRKAQAKLRLEQPSVLLESQILRSSSTELKRDRSYRDLSFPGSGGRNRVRGLVARSERD